MFGGALETACQFAEMLATDGVQRGLIGPREAARLWDRHLLNCAVVAELLPEAGELVDIGSGAGLPGVVLAMLRPRIRVVLLEPMLRRSVFLEECVARLDLPNATVVRALAPKTRRAAIKADMATARAVAPLDRLAGWAAAAAAPRGRNPGDQGAVRGAGTSGRPRPFCRDLACEVRRFCGPVTVGS